MPAKMVDKRRVMENVLHGTFQRRVHGAAGGVNHVQGPAGSLLAPASSYLAPTEKLAMFPIATSTLWPLLLCGTLNAYTRRS